MGAVVYDRIMSQSGETLTVTAECFKVTCIDYNRKRNKIMVMQSQIIEYKRNLRKAYDDTLEVVYASIQNDDGDRFGSSNFELSLIETEINHARLRDVSDWEEFWGSVEHEGWQDFFAEWVLS